MINQELIKVVDHKNLNEDLPEFERITPTVENIAVFAWNRIVGKFGPSASLGTGKRYCTALPYGKPIRHTVHITGNLLYNGRAMPAEIIGDCPAMARKCAKCGVTSEIEEAFQKSDSSDEIFYCPACSKEKSIQLGESFLLGSFPFY